MKALVVCEDDDVIEKITEATTASGYDNIVYRRVMKALDNVEEISPDVVILSACDYPRHWKPFISYSRGFLKKIPEVILYVSKYFSEDEKKKADALFVKGVFSNINADGIYKLKTLISTKKEHNAALYGVKILRDPRKENKTETNPLNATAPKVNLFDKKTDGLSKTNLFDTKDDILPKTNWFGKKFDDEPEIDFFNTKDNEKPKTDSSAKTNFFDEKSDSKNQVDLFEKKIEEKPKANLFDKKFDSSFKTNFFETNTDGKSEINLFSTKKDSSPILNWFDKEIDDEPEIDFFNTKPAKKTEAVNKARKHSNTMMFTHPYSGAFVTGTIKSISDDETLIDFSPDIKIQRLSAGDNINSLSLSTMRGIRSCKAIIERIDDGLITVKVA